MSVRIWALCGSVLLLAGCGSAETTTPAAISSTSEIDAPASQPSASADQTSIEKFNQAIKKEPKVIDFVYDPRAVFQWTIGVADDGSPRHGYAEYFCQLMSDYGLPAAGAKVRIVDYRKFMQPGGNGRDASLGSVNCETSEHMTP